MFVQPIVEDLVQELILFKLFKEYRPEIDLYGAIGKRGNTYIRENLRGFNRASRSLPHVIITDLDNFDCPSLLRDEWIDFPINPKFIFRIAVKEAEAWLMADREGFSAFIGTQLNRIPHNSEEINDPKEFIVSLARRSKKKSIKDLIPIGISKVGPGYNPLIQDFIMKHWNTKNAMLHSLSLSKAILRIGEI